MFSALPSIKYVGCHACGNVWDGIVENKSGEESKKRWNWSGSNRRPLRQMRSALPRGMCSCTETAGHIPFCRNEPVLPVMVR